VKKIELTPEQVKEIWQRVADLQSSQRKIRVAFADAMTEMMNDELAVGRPVANRWRMTPLEWVDVEAEFGNLNPLRSRHPDIAHLINYPEPKKGDKGNRSNHALTDRDPRLLEAIEDIPLIEQAVFEIVGKKAPRQLTHDLAAEMFSVKKADIHRYFAAKTKRERQSKRPTK